MATFLRGTTGYANGAEALGLFLAFWACKYSMAWHVIAQVSVLFCIPVLVSTVILNRAFT